MAKAKRYAYVLTAEHNQYDQYGEYFVALFEEIPTVEKLAEFLADQQEHVSVPTKVLEAVAFLEHIRKGGGRRKDEDSWYNLKRVEVR
jgi:hypothetical protein